MSKKKSYMNKSNLINEGIIDKIFDYIKRGKIRRLQKAFRNQPEIKKRILKLNKDAEDLERYWKSRGKDIKIPKI